MVVVLGDTCIVVEDVQVGMAFVVKFVASTESTPIDHDISDEILGALGLPTTTEELVDNGVELVTDLIVDALDAATAFLDAAENLMLPSATSAAGVIDFVTLKIYATVSGTQYTWHQDPASLFCNSQPVYWKEAGAWETTVDIYSKLYNFPLDPNVLEPTGAKEFVKGLKELFTSVQNELTATPINAQNVIEGAVNGSANVVIYPWP